jgi:hypothetical protein
MASGGSVRSGSAGAKGIKKKRPRLGRVAEGLHSRLIASFGVGRKSHVGTGLSSKSSR